MTTHFSESRTRFSAVVEDICQRKNNSLSSNLKSTNPPDVFIGKLCNLCVDPRHISHRGQQFLPPSPPSAFPCLFPYENLYRVPILPVVLTPELSASPCDSLIEASYWSLPFPTCIPYSLI